MIGALPCNITIDDVEYPIRTDFRDCLLIISAFMDDGLADEEKAFICLKILYKDTIPENNIEQAYKKACWFLNGGKFEDIDENSNNKPQLVLYNWEKDEQIIFSAINKVAGREVRADAYLHWWTFLGLFNEIGEGSFATIVNIRQKKAKHKKLEKWEQEFYREHKDMIDLKQNKRSEADRKALDEFLKGV